MVYINQLITGGVPPSILAIGQSVVKSPNITTNLVGIPKLVHYRGQASSANKYCPDLPWFSEKLPSGKRLQKSMDSFTILFLWVNPRNFDWAIFAILTSPEANRLMLKSPICCISPVVLFDPRIQNSKPLQVIF